MKKFCRYRFSFIIPFYDHFSLTLFSLAPNFPLYLLLNIWRNSALISVHLRSPLVFFFLLLCFAFHNYSSKQYGIAFFEEILECFQWRLWFLILVKKEACYFCSINLLLSLSYGFGRVSFVLFDSFSSLCAPLCAQPSTKR